jgi:hypothetical protein
VANDYRRYIEGLSPREQLLVHNHDIRFYEGGSDQRAVEISLPIEGTWWKHVLFYDKNNRRVKVVKYAASRYIS